MMIWFPRLLSGIDMNENKCFFIRCFIYLSLYISLTCSAFFVRPHLWLWFLRNYDMISTIYIWDLYKWKLFLYISLYISLTCSAFFVRPHLSPLHLLLWQISLPPKKSLSNAIADEKLKKIKTEKYSMLHFWGFLHLLF